MTSVEDVALERMINFFRVIELQSLLQFMGQNKYGKKSELVERCLNQLRSQKTPELVSKIKQIYADLQATSRGYPDISTNSSSLPAPAPGISASGSSARATNAVAVASSSIPRGPVGVSAIPVPSSRGPANVMAGSVAGFYSTSTGSVGAAAPIPGTSSGVRVFNHGIRPAPPSRTLNPPQMRYVEFSNVGSQPVREPCVRMMQRVPGPGSSHVRMPPPEVPLPSIIKLKELHMLKTDSVVLIPPTVLENRITQLSDMSANTFTIKVTPDQAKQLLALATYSTEGSKREYIKKQIVLRFCALDYSTSEQEDLFPPGLLVMVNNRIVDLVGQIPGFSSFNCRCRNCIYKISKPLNITHAAQLSMMNTSASTISVFWEPKNDYKRYAMSASIVERRSTEEIFSRLVNNGSQPVAFTKARISEIMKPADDDDILALTSLPVSLACPIGKKRMAHPCRAKTCRHLQCFDAEFFLQMQERNEKFTLICPICHGALKLEDLIIDQYFSEIIRGHPKDAGDEIEIHSDGSWEPAVKQKNVMKKNGKGMRGGQEHDADSGADDMSSLGDKTILLDLDSSNEEAPPATTNPISNSGGPAVQRARPAQGPNVEIVDLTND